MLQPTQVREAQLEDIAAIAKLEELIFSDMWSESGLKSTTESEFGNIMVCEDLSSRILGYMIYYSLGNEMELVRIATAPEARGEGIGLRMMEHLIDIATADKRERILLEVRESNIQAVKLYQQFEFAQIGTRKNFYTKPIEDGKIMEKVL